MFATALDGELWSGESDQLSDEDLYRLTQSEAAHVENRAQDSIPRDLDSAPPGPYLAAVLASIDRGKLSGYDLVEVMRARARQIAHEQAQLYADMAEMAHCEGPGLQRSPHPVEFSSDEVRAALRMTRRTAESEMSFALELRDRLPRVFETLLLGDLDVRRAKVIYHQTRNVSAETARAVVDAIIDVAPDLTSGQLYHRLRRLCIDIDPEAAKKRFEASLEERRVVSEVNPQGTANILGLDLEPHQVGRAMRRMRRMAMSMRRSGDPRTMDQLMADVFVDVLNGHRDDDTRGAVVMHVDLATLVELNDKAGELAGFTPVIADIARQVAAEQVNGEWRWIATHPDSGAILADGTTRRRPTAEQRRFVEAHHRTCIHPGCRMPAADCDLDHTKEWATGGRTMVENLPPACRHDHILRHEGGWSYRRMEDGTYVWTSRLGHRYTSKPRAP